MLENLLGVFLICSPFSVPPFCSPFSKAIEYAARLRGASTRWQKFHRLKSESSPIHLDKLSHIREIMTINFSDVSTYFLRQLSDMEIQNCKDSNTQSKELL